MIFYYIKIKGNPDISRKHMSLYTNLKTLLEDECLGDENFNGEKMKTYADCRWTGWETNRKGHFDKTIHKINIKL